MFPKFGHRHKMLDTRSSANPKKEKYQKKNAYLILWKVHIKIKS